MAKEKKATYDRVCVSIPMALSQELREAYPTMEFSPLITQLLMYAHEARFLTRLQDITPAVDGKRTGRPKMVAPPDTTSEIEEFGA